MLSVSQDRHQEIMKNAVNPGIASALKDLGIVG